MSQRSRGPLYDRGESVIVAIGTELMMISVFSVIGPTNDSNEPLAENFGLAYRPSIDYPVPGHTASERDSLREQVEAVSIGEIHSATGEFLIEQAISSYYTYYYLAVALSNEIVLANRSVRAALLGLLRAQGRTAIIDVAGVFDNDRRSTSLVRVVGRVKKQVESGDRARADRDTIAHIGCLIDGDNLVVGHYEQSRLRISADFVVQTKNEIRYAKALRNAFAAHPSYTVKIDPADKLGITVQWDILERVLVLAVNVYDYLAAEFSDDVGGRPSIGEGEQFRIALNSTTAEIVRDNARREVDALIDGLTSVPGYVAPEEDAGKVWGGASGRRRKVINHFGRCAEQLLPGAGGVDDVESDDVAVAGINAAVTRLMHERPVQTSGGGDESEWLLNAYTVAALLGSTDAAVSRSRRAKKLAAFKDGDVWVFPTFQFVRTDPGSEEWTVDVELVDRWWESGYEGSSGWATFQAGEREVSAGD
ncbi:hypothetical protein [Rhodococcus qingshengii]|uniref:hypothetical protein n=1 Tax=Rhodococcus qingshengii TaxID=334542 RepID=UPI0021B15343|nr:hypothetical protein [Rhodococcus qingshengii]MCT6736591.1 hypothetical protein [Rhodococcus qingshengii]